MYPLHRRTRYRPQAQRWHETGLPHIDSEWPVEVDLNDESVKARDIVTTILSRVLKEAPSNIHGTKSIKALAGGRSTLENEIVGDLHAEFGSLPERAEDAPLSEVWDALQSGHKQTLGKITTGLVNTLFTSKLPNGFITAVARDHLLDPGALQELSESQRALSRQLLNIYAAYIGVDQSADRRALGALHLDVEPRLQSELDLWTSEHGEDYANGIRPRFDPRKVRSSDSAWNWARQRLLELFDLAASVQCGEDDVTSLDHSTISEACYAIANAADETIFPVLDEMMSKLRDSSVMRIIFLDLESYCRQLVESVPVFRASCTSIDEEGNIKYSAKPRSGAITFADLAIPTSEADEREPFLHLKEKAAHGWWYSQALTGQLHAAFTLVEEQGESFTGQTVLITGAGVGSIGAAMIRHFLQGGAKVVTTTSSLSPELARKYQRIYTDYGARGSQLVVVPFNQASTQDVTALIVYIYSSHNGLGWDLDFVVPLHQ
ncbi:hypothetical protein BDV09DRAFT_200628 [Aspergillus tetrazonus]